MKKISILLLLFATLSLAKGQCIDAIITSSNDTIYGKLLDTANAIYTFDSYNYVFALSKDMVKEYILCIRQATKADILRMKQLDNLSGSDLFKHTPGYYLRKSTKNFYVGICLLAGGLTANTLGFTYFKNTKAETPVFAVGSIAAAGGIFFLLRSFYFIDKTGKLLDLERSSIYLVPNQNGDLEFKLKF
ncbi:MAG: hypothetical protein WC142_07335 [Bacteroidales bacterium]|jgi:hypothetical protein|nr:hypothetical protein [Bacteroidales bacterium]MDD2687617.1 hypothetical protein [Bacteroidales bacterium]MDD3331225.1 hypothetical protein [Bacteroidales bacterium]MDD3692056.1 hypothetical protein [Bacteroidales bacterium]MDD4045151.1 hypothetical protein [Bacteroidales bacterium]